MGRLFGTDGVRGIANTELSCELALNIGRAAASVLSNGTRRRPVFVVGCDTRMSSDMLCCAVTAGLCSYGADVINLGVVPTPAVAYLVGKYKADAGVMISASHNPAEFNGIKLFSGDGYKLPDMIEEQIESIVLDSDDDDDNPNMPIGGDVGKIYSGYNAIKDYTDHVKSSVPNSLDGLKIAIDCANGSASVTAERLFTSLGAECIFMSNTPDGENINRNCGSTHIEALAECVKKNGLDAGVAFDGDADRCLCVDENGNLVDGDVIMAICAVDLSARGKLNKNTVVGTVMTNFGFGKFCEENGLRFVSTKVGDRFVLEEMLLEEYDFGGEQSGHIIFRDFATTGDGQLTAVQLLAHLKRSGEKLSKLASVMKKYPQVMINLKISAEGKLHFYTNREVKEALDNAKRALGKTGRVVVRPSGTEPLIRVMVEGEDEAVIAEVANMIASVIREQLA